MQGYTIVTNNPKIAVVFTQLKFIIATTVSAGWGQRDKCSAHHTY